MFVLVAGLHAAASTNACPACNIYNKLGRSLADSANVVVGKLAARMDDNEILVEVIRPLRGSYRPGQTYVMRAWTLEPAGKLLIFSDSKRFQPTFPVLDMQFEDEVLFLLNRPKIDNVDEAIRRVQGWSNESRDAGMAYLRQCKPFPSAKLIEATESARKLLFAGKKVWGAQNRLGNLIEALMLSDDEEGQDYLLRQVELYLKQREGSLDWSKIPRVVTDRGEWLTALVGLAGKEWDHRRHAAENPYRKPQPQLREKEKQMMLKALPDLGGVVLAETVYALCETGASTPKQLLSLLKPSQSKDEFALGVLWSTRGKMGPFSGGQGAEALTDLELIRPVATEPELKKQIAESAGFGWKWWKEETLREILQPFDSGVGWLGDFE